MEPSSLQVHWFDDHSSAAAAMATINAGEGLGEPEQGTTTYTEIYQHTDGRYYIVSDETTTKYLGEGETLNIDVNAA